MKYVLETPPQSEPITLADTKQHLRIDHDDDDELITALISAARQHAETFTDRAFMPQTWYLYLDAVDLFGDCHDALLLSGSRPLRIASKHPIIDVDTFEYQETQGTWKKFQSIWDEGGSFDQPGKLFDDKLYVFDVPTCKIYPIFGRYWPLACWPYISGWRAKFRAGYADAESVPGPIKLAIKTLVLHMYENRAAYAENTLSSVPAAFENLLFSYKLLNFNHAN